MATFEEHINSINTKLQQFIKKYAALQKENALLSREMEKLKANEKISAEKVESLEIQLSILKGSEGSMTDKEKSNFEKRINQYIRDLDKCIAMINN